jgi:tetratricopeptide (TPR) repeat protein
MRAHRYGAAQATIERALAVFQKCYGDGDPRAGDLLSHLAQIRLRLGDCDVALDLQRRDLELTERKLGGQHPSVGRALLVLASIVEARGDLATALQHAERAVAILHKSLAWPHQSLLSASTATARLLGRSGRLEDARRRLEPVLGLAPAHDAAKLARLEAVLVRSEIERLAGNLSRALELVSEVIADPLTAGDTRLLSQAHFAQAYAHARAANKSAALAACERALTAMPRELSGPARPVAYAEAKFWALLGEGGRAVELVRAAVAGGCVQRAILADQETQVSCAGFWEQMQSTLGI